MNDKPQTIWEIAAKAQKIVETWPEWKIRAADLALVSRPPRIRPGPKATT